MIKNYSLLLMSLFFIGISVQNSQAVCSMADSTQKGMMEKQCAQMNQMDQRKMCCNMGPMMYGHKMSCHRHACKMLAALVILFFVIINILLTTLVARDMMKSGRFNRLWIPLVLILGICGTVLYALFRIGDNLKAVEEKK